MRSFGKIPYFRLPQTPESFPLDGAFGGDERLRLIFVINIITYLRKKYIVLLLRRCCDATQSSQIQTETRRGTSLHFSGG